MAETPVMIDKRGSVDRDDALLVRRGDDGWELEVYIADVASGVAPGSDADVQAFQRRESAYGGVRGTKKMLPRPIETRLTLAEGRSCAAVRVRVELTPDGLVRATHVDRARLEGAVAMDHGQVAGALAEEQHPLRPMLRAAADLAEVLLARRRDGGALALYDLLHGWATTEEGTLVQVAPSKRTIGYKIVQECMIAANTALANWAAARDLPVLFRNHTVANVAPPRADLLADLETAVADGTPARIEALQQRALLVMRRAVYAPHMGGHWGLNLPGYVHATSPLRRYADLVTQRLITSTLDGAPLPYTAEQLDAIAQVLNAGAAADAEAKNQRFKDARHREARQAASTQQDYSALPDRQFHAVLKRAAAENIANPDLVKDAARRAEEGLLTHRQVQMVLLETSGEEWEPARQACLDVLAQSPEEAVSVLSVHAQSTGQELPAFCDEAKGKPPHTVFTVQATFSRHSGQARAASTKKAARHQAALSLLADLAGLPDPSADHAEQIPAPPKETVAVPAQGRQPVMVLNEYEQKRIIGELQYESAREGPSHVPTFICSASARHRGEVLTAQGTAPAKAAAKSEAAARLLQEIQARQ
ncbi:RNB domain-containing ribonuclease [Streptomyces nanshensis]|uniref:RNB domain-containing ribonuclease n=1 Tax=Streptomyces nanshensis TaxID=518642 RepID=UPI00085C6EF7|nr:RNB domain-containing ribonuclease [Streptomyces nanshensis]